CSSDLTVGALDALELLPTSGPLEQLLDGLGGLGAHAQPVLGTLGVDLDEARVLLGAVQSDVLDSTTVTTGAGVRDHDPVLRVAEVGAAGERDRDARDASRC